LNILAKDITLLDEVLTDIIHTNGLDPITKMLEYYQSLLGFLQRQKAYGLDSTIVSDIISIYGVKLIDCAYLDFLGDSVLLKRGSTIIDHIIKSKGSLYVIEQGLNIVAGRRQACL
jgi:hypothetical protein